MSYLKAYLSAFLFNATLLGTLFFGIMVFNRGSLLADYFVYICVIASIGGPIAVLLRKKES